MVPLLQEADDLEPDVATKDGRFQRSARTRQLVLDAFLSLIDEGDITPTAQRIAERAGVSLRTVYHQFNDVDTIHELGGQRLAERLDARLFIVPTSGPLGRRVDAFARNRMEVNSSIHNIASAARLREPFSLTLRRSRDSLIRRGEQEIRLVFARELTALPEPARDTLVSAVALVSNWPSWYSLREELGLSSEAAEQVMRASLRALLGSRSVFVNSVG